MTLIKKEKVNDKPKKSSKVIVKKEKNGEKVIVKKESFEYSLMNDKILDYSIKQFIVINLACGIPFDFAYSDLSKLIDPNIFDKADA